MYNRRAWHDQDMKFVICLCLLACASFAQAPSTVIHIINVKWKADATPEQVRAVVDAVQQLPMRYPGMKRVWTKSLKYEAQNGFKQAIVMEFDSQDSLKRYENSAAQKWWYDMYLPLRDDSRTYDLTN